MSKHKIIIRVKAQEADLYRDNDFIKTYKVSTALNGIGCEVGTNKTPSGILKVSKKIGEGCEMGTVFRARAVTGEMWSTEPENPLCSSEEDLVTTRILWLEGCEEKNLNTLNRYIYLHGTNQEYLLGKPVSHGCIRFSNNDILEIFDEVPEGAIVEVLE